MATIKQNYQTLFDLATESDGKGVLLPIVEMMSEVNAILQDLPMIACNSGDFHKGVIRNGLPKGTFRKIYGGVAPEKTEKTAVTDTTCMLEAFSEVDEAVAIRSGNVNRYRLREAKAFLEGLSQSMAHVLIYGDNTKNPEQIHGFASRYDCFGTDKKKSSFNVLDGGGTSNDNTSIWLINWGEDSVTGLYPQGARTKIGVAHDPLGRIKKDLADGSSYMTLADHFISEFGLHVADWRRVVRVSNLATGNFGTSSACDITSLMRKATYRIPGGASSNTTGRLAWYMNADALEELERQYYAKENMQLTKEDADGKPVMIFRGIPVRQVDQIINDEAAVLAEA